jgi:hypothetical protein
LFEKSSIFCSKKTGNLAREKRLPHRNENFQRPYLIPYCENDRILSIHLIHRNENGCIFSLLLIHGGFPS